MLHRIKKKHDLNQDKWIGIGGKFEDGESPEDCLLRGGPGGDRAYPHRLPIPGDRHLCLRPVAHGVYAPVHRRRLYRNPEGVRRGRSGVDPPRARLLELPHWEGDAIFLALLDREEEPFFSLKLRYEGETLAEAVLNGTHLKGGPAV